MTTLVPITYKGGVYRHDEIVDLIDDLGGYIVQKHVMAQEVVLQSFVPRDDVGLIRRIAKPLAGEVIEAPLVGTEIAVVSPSLEIHHLPHTSCDIAEYLRRAGAKTNMVGLARGFGKRIANLSAEERDVINEHDLAVYVLGSFEECLRQKFPVLRRGVDVPIVLTGAPDRETLTRITDPPVEGYVGDVGRIMHRFKRPEEIRKLDELVDEVSRALDARRDEIAKDPLSIFPARLMDILEEKVQEVSLLTHPTPVTAQLAGLRVKLPYEEYADALRALEIADGVTVGDIAEVLPSKMRNYILIRIKPYSETRIMV
ncbi:methanogenesis marker 7 protein [Methanoculleus sp. FWC-SCC1]|uniref:Methanogenesis marker 7 protein n=1 Tax=Methanoculleus frigidifontis TaxID=2584085 RepID=A0ABT8ME25_9EURY|nr:methanogenesis marker 7 protein [Methanoculleus sp. FWC-SCC1]MDN7026192.1 methanogenesis marker 7 protein [Methanoculleus sp. FWC-SCC1]